MISLVSMRDLQAEQLRELYDCESRITRMLPDMIKLAWHDSLADAFRSHLSEVRLHVARLAGLLESLEPATGGTPTGAFDGLVGEISGSFWSEKPDEVLDVALIIDLRRLLAVAIAGYTTLIALAEATGDLAMAGPLRQMLEEVVIAEHRLVRLARHEVNPDGALAGIPEEARRLGIGTQWTDF